MLAAAVIFAAISIYNEARRAPAGSYGRLFGTQVAVPNGAIARKVDIISEAPVTDQRASDPMLVAPAAREQVLLNTNVPAPAPTTTTAITPASPASPTVTGAEDHGTTIVGDGTGVAIVHATSTSTAPRQVLAGGIFKQQ